MRILVVEDDADLSRQLKDALKDVGYAVDIANDGEEGHFLGDTEPYDAVVLDLGLPLIDGVSVLQKWRADGKSFPVLILTARDQWSEKVAGFDAGADDYLTKPFHTEELMARLRALLRRAAGHTTDTIDIGELSVDNRSARAFVNGMSIKLTSHEFRLLSYMATHRGRVISGVRGGGEKPIPCSAPCARGGFLGFAAFATDGYYADMALSGHHLSQF